MATTNEPGQATPRSGPMSRASQMQAPEAAESTPVYTDDTGRGVINLWDRAAPARANSYAGEERRVADRRCGHLDRRAHRTVGNLAVLRPAARPAPSSFCLSFVMPAYNEEATLASAVARILDTDLSCEFELVVVDDGSSDATPAILAAIDDDRLVVYRHPRNLGKGAAVLSGVRVATGTHLLVFDADLEYDPTDVARLVEAAQRADAQIVYGTRMFGNHTLFPSYWFAIGNRLTTLSANLLFNSYISDLHTCLKLIPLELFRQLRLTENGFGLDTEITAEILRRGLRPFEVPVSYVGRSVAEGKKITWRDGGECLKVLVKVRMRRDNRPGRAVQGTASRS